METHTGGCHCGKVRFETKLDLTQPVIECNCSHCQIKGLLLTFIPRDTFTLLTGQEDLTEYRFNTHKIEHSFCRICGVEAFGFGEGPEGAKTAAINVRSIDNIDLGALTRHAYDGRDGK